MIDCHCHLLPGIDDGAKDTEMSVAMAELAAATGTREVICTPHHANGAYTNTRENILRRVREWQEFLLSRGVGIRLRPGSELHLVPELPAMLANGEALTYNDRDSHALIELPKNFIPQGADTILETLAYQGITPVIAHPERNAELVADPKRASRWVDEGCALQLTGQSCTGDFGPTIKQVCDFWIARGEAHLVASDGHRPRGRAPRLDHAYTELRERYDRTTADLLTRDNPARLISGDELEAPPRIARTRGGFQEFVGRLLGG